MAQIARIRTNASFAGAMLAGLLAAPGCTRSTEDAAGANLAEPGVTAGTAAPQDDVPEDDEEIAGSSEDDGGGPPAVLDVPADDEGPDTEEEECAELSAQADLEQKPADIIWVVDNSPSMLDETAAVQQRLGEFSQQIVGADIDVRVLLVTSYPYPGVDPSIDTGICIAPPLGGGGCPLGDNNPPTFGHIDLPIGSHHALSKLLETHEQWSQMVRDDSSVHVIVVTDDDSDLDADSFHEQFLALDPRHEGYQLHGIVPLTPCAEAETLGATYIELAEQTGGILGDLCEQEFAPLFGLLSTAVTEGTALDCAWPMPDAPQGATIDPDTVSVLFEDDGGVVTELVPVQGPEACGALDLAWYYADPDDPTQLVACPQTCEVLEAAATGSLDIEVGCATKPVG